MKLSASTAKDAPALALIHAAAFPAGAGWTAPTITTLLGLGGVFGFLYIPISVLVALSFNEGGLPTAWTGFSVKWYGALWQNADILQAALNTLVVGLVSAGLATSTSCVVTRGLPANRRNADSATSPTTTSSPAITESMPRMPPCTRMKGLAAVESGTSVTTPALME